MIGRRHVCLVTNDGEDWFVSVRITMQTPAAPTIDHCGRTFRRTSQRTDGGWQVYRET